MSKIFERLFLKRLHKDANIDQKIPTHQFGFRENHSTIQQCHRIVHGILQSLEEKKICTAAFLIFSKHSTESGTTASYINLNNYSPHLITSCSNPTSRTVTPK